MSKKKKLPEKYASAPTPKQAAAESRFQADLETREEAAELDENGKLPLNATHALIKKPDGTIEVKRARLKLF